MNSFAWQYLKNFRKISTETQKLKIKAFLFPTELVRNFQLWENTKDKAVIQTDEGCVLVKTGLFSFQMI